MRRRTHIESLIPAVFFWLIYSGACTHNPPTRTLDAGTGGDGGSGATTASTSPSASTTGSMGGDAGVPDAGGASGAAGEGGSGGEVDPCLPEHCESWDDCELDVVQELELEICRFRIARCPDQPSDLMFTPEPVEPIEAQLGAASTATRPQLGEQEAAKYTIETVLEGGGVFETEYTGSGEGGAPGEPLGERTLSYERGPWDPRGPLADVTKIVPGFVVDPDDPNGGNEDEGIYTTLQSAISKAVNVEGCPRVYIKVMPGTYREKITVPAKTSTPPITIYGESNDPGEIVIVSGHSSAGAENDGTPLTIHASATFTNSLPQPLHVRNLTIQNDYVAGTYPGEEDVQTAVALLTQADRALFDNVQILGHRNALYVKSTGTNEVSRAYFRNCYLEGDEDMILGRGAAVFDGCQIHSLGDRVSTGAIAAPSTRVENPHGLLIVNSELTADDDVVDVYLGRQWYEGQDPEAVGKAIIRNSILGVHIRSTDPWAPVPRLAPNNPSGAPIVLFTSDDYYVPTTGLVPAETYLSEFGNSGPGSAP